MCLWVTHFNARQVSVAVFDDGPRDAVNIESRAGRQRTSLVATKAKRRLFKHDFALQLGLEPSVGGVDRVEARVSFTLGTNVEDLTLTGTGDLSGQGNALANVIIGNTGDNTLNGLAGADTLTGGVGDDIFKFTTALSASNIDRITDFVHGEDLLQLENSVFMALGANGVLAATAFHTGAAAADAADRIIYDSATGALLYDADGNGAGAAVQFATLGTGLGLTNTDIFVI